MASLGWYWHRLRAMGPAEMGSHLRRKVHQFADARRARDWSGKKLERCGAFPGLPERERVPESLRAGLVRDSERILRGEWRAFGHLPLTVDDPPRWQEDYLVGMDLATEGSAFGLNHRRLPAGADVKLIWELSRWHELVRLAQASWVLDDPRAGQKCVRWLEDWVLHNPPYRGWNWTSALESGMRLIQFVWIDALLGEDEEARGYDARLEGLWYQLLPSHVWFTWRYKTAGSSANNHLLGELAGLIVANVRWPGLSAWGPGLPILQRLWQREVLAQFFPDGGNREQALNYQLFSWELCWQAQEALKVAGCTVAPEVEARLGAAMRFFVEVQVEEDPWDYGDSDNAFVTPVFRDAPVREWVRWGMGEVGAVDFWWGRSERPKGATRTVGKAVVFPDTGQVVWRAGEWVVRWDVSPLGYQSTAAHGHLDALHLSFWVGGVAMVIDPGTGAYYGDEGLRVWLASREAHNAPCPQGVEFPKRVGPFLWEEHHPKPVLERISDRELTGSVSLAGVRVCRRLIRLEEGRGWRVEDECGGGTGRAFEVRWQFGPGALIERLGAGRYRVRRQERSLWMECDGGLEIEQGGGGYEGVVSPGFRVTCKAPYLLLKVPEKPCVLRTTFLASAPS